MKTEVPACFLENLLFYIKSNEPHGKQELVMDVLDQEWRDRESGVEMKSCLLFKCQMRSDHDV